MIRKHWPALAAAYAWFATVCGATAFLVRGRRAAGVSVEIGEILLWQALVYALWIPVGLAVALLLKRFHLRPAAMAATLALAVPSVLLHAFLAGLLDRRWSPRMAELGVFEAVVARLPVNLLFYLAIAGAVWALASHRRSLELTGALEAARASQQRSRPAADQLEQSLLVSIGNRRIPVPIDTIEWIGAAGNYVVINWDAGEGLVRASLQEMEQRLDPDRFARVHRSTLANLAMVGSASSLSDGSWRLTMRSGAELVASRTYRDRILARLGGPRPEGQDRRRQGR